MALRRCSSVVIFNNSTILILKGSAHDLFFIKIVFTDLYDWDNCFLMFETNLVSKNYKKNDRKHNSWVRDVLI